MPPASVPPASRCRASARASACVLGTRGLSARVLALVLVLCGLAGGARADPPPIALKIVGGLATISQYVRYEEPFWRDRIPALTRGRVRADIVPFDRAGIRGQEALQLIRLGVVPFGTVLLTLAAADEPEFNAIDLPMANPDIAALRETVAAWRPRIAELLRDRYGIKLLAIYTYPAQVTFCRRPFTALGDLAGRRVRVSSVGQGELMTALGATPVVTPFAEMVQAIRAGVVECAITGSLSGNAAGLHEVTSHVSRAAIAWGVSVFVANGTAWNALPAEVRADLQAAIAGLETEIWDGAARETEEGFACNAGRPGCTAGRPGRMVVVEDAPQDAARRLELLRDTVLPAWVQRCGAECATLWNQVLGDRIGIRARTD